MKTIRNLSLVFFLVLFGWYLMVFIQPLPGLLIDGKASLQSVMGLLLLLLALVLGAYLLKWKYADPAALVVLAAWAYLQFNANWLYWFAEAPPDRVQSYNDYFNGTYRIFPPSDIRIVPDAYHFILGVLLFINLGIVLWKIVLPLPKKIKTSKHPPV